MIKWLNNISKLIITLLLIAIVNVLFTSKVHSQDVDLYFKIINSRPADKYDISFNKFGVDTIIYYGQNQDNQVAVFQINESYNSDGYLDTRIKKSRYDDKYLNYQKYVKKYQSEGVVNRETYSLWDDMLFDWKITDDCHITYLNDQIYSIDIYKRITSTDSLKRVFKVENSFDLNDTLRFSAVLQYDTLNYKWDSVAIIDYSYSYSTGKITKIVKKRNSTTLHWENYLKAYATYKSSSLIENVDYSLWNDIQKKWYYSSRESHVYDALNNNIMTKKYTYNAFLSEWIISDQIEYTYNQEKMVGMVYSYYDLINQDLSEYKTVDYFFDYDNWEETTFKNNEKGYWRTEYTYTIVEPNSSTVQINLFNENKLTFYPNPVQTYLNITNYSDYIGNKYYIYDLEGIKIDENIVTSGRMDVSSLDYGIFILKIENKNGSVTHHKFLKVSR